MFIYGGSTARCDFLRSCFLRRSPGNNIPVPILKESLGYPAVWPVVILLGFEFFYFLTSMLPDAVLSIPRCLVFDVRVISTLTALYLQCQIHCSCVKVDLQILLYSYWTALNLGRGKHATTSVFYPLMAVLEPLLAGASVLLQTVQHPLSFSH